MTFSAPAGRVTGCQSTGSPRASRSPAASSFPGARVIFSNVETVRDLVVTELNRRLNLGSSTLNETWLALTLMSTPTDLRQNASATTSRTTRPRNSSHFLRDGGEGFTPPGAPAPVDGSAGAALPVA